MRHPPTTVDPVAPAPGRRAAFAAGAVAVATALMAAFAQARGAPRLQVALPLLGAAGLGMAWLALTRFSLFLATILALRASLDVLKLSPQAVGALDPGALLSGTFLVAGGIWLIAQPREHRAPRSPLLVPLAVFTAVAALSTAGAASPAQGMVDVVKLATVVLMLAVLNQVCRTEGDTRIVLVAAMASAIPPLLLAAYQGITHTGLHFSGDFERVRGTFSHPNPFAIYLCMTIIMAAAIIRSVRPLAQAALAALVVGCSVALFFTYTRSAWIATVLGVLVVGLMIGRRAVAIVAVLTVVVALSIPSIAARFADLGTSTTQSGAAGNSLVWRIGYWKQALELNDDPLIGKGLSAVREEGSESKEPHNDFIRTYVETGIIGFLAYVWFLLRGYAVVRRGIRDTAPGFWRDVAIGFAGISVAFAILSLVSNVITQLVLLWYLASYATAAIAAPRLAPRLARREHEPAPDGAASPVIR